MKIEYDTNADAIYFSVRKGRISKTVPVSRFLNIDVDAKGNTIGIEILGASSKQGSELQKNIRRGIPVKIIGSKAVAA